MQLGSEKSHEQLGANGQRLRWKKGILVLGPNDMSLARRLRKKAGSDHRKYVRQIFVSVDITAPLYWWEGV